MVNGISMPHTMDTADGLLRNDSHKSVLIPLHHCKTMNFSISYKQKKDSSNTSINNFFIQHQRILKEVDLQFNFSSILYGFPAVFFVLSGSLINEANDMPFGIFFCCCFVWHIELCLWEPLLKTSKNFIVHGQKKKKKEHTVASFFSSLTQSAINKYNQTN